MFKLNWLAFTSKFVQLIELRSGMIRVEGIVPIHQSAEINRANGPSRRRSGSRVPVSGSGCRRLLRPEPDPPQQREPLKRHRVLPIRQTLFQLIDLIQQDALANILHRPDNFNARAWHLSGVFLLEMLKRMRIRGLGSLRRTICWLLRGSRARLAKYGHCQQ